MNQLLSVEDTRVADGFEIVKTDKFQVLRICELNLRKLKQLENRIEILEGRYEVSELAAAKRLVSGRAMEMQKHNAEFNPTKNEQRVVQAANSLELMDIVKFIRVEDNYYNVSFEQRINMVNGLHPRQLCKSLLYKNSANHFFLLIIQYIRSLDRDKLGRVTKACGFKPEELAFVPEEELNNVAGFASGGVAPLGLKGLTAGKNLTVVIDEHIYKLTPPEIYLGAGEVNSKLFVANVNQFSDILQAKNIKLTE
eukprot:snap_masked-scaffold_6-processed-gene-14.16-mRNA-1 protein AED:1.00 eAED:1.00 QI:0/-1/0/0/-1/1/1/0/252